MEEADARWALRFQDAALDPGEWLPALQDLADATGSARAELVGFGGPGFVPFNWVTSVDERTLDDFVAAGGTSPQYNYRIAADDGRSVMTVADEAAYQRARATLRGSDYVDFCAQYDMLFGCQTVLARENGGLVGMSVLRSRADGHTDEAARSIFATAARAARTAVRMQQAIENQGHQLLRGTLEAMALPALLLDGFGNVRAATGPAETLLEGNAAIAVSGRRLGSRYPRTERKLDQALRSVLGPTASPHARVLIGDPGVPSLVVDIFALPARDWSLPFAPRALVTMRDPRARRADSAAVLMTSFGLTAAEAGIALLLSAGLPREEIARRRGVAAETLRTQLRSLYSKTGCARETELVLLVKAMVD